MDLEYEKIIELDSNASLIATTLHFKLLPIVNQLVAEAERSNVPPSITPVQKEEILSLYTTLGNQVDALQNCILSEYTMSIVVPNGIPHPKATPTPDLLSTMVTKEEKEELYTHDLPTSNELAEIFTKEDSDALQSLLTIHSEKVNEIVDEFSKQFDSWKEKHKKIKSR